MADRPDLPNGYSICAYTPSNVAATGGAEGVLETSFPDWKVQEYVGDDDDFLYYRFTALDGSDSFWAWPDEVDCSGTGASKPSTGDTLKSRIRQIQSRLNTHYTKHANYPLVVDGVFGPKTCGAAYGFQAESTGYDGPELTGQFFVALGLPEVWTTAFKTSCSSYYKTTPVPTPTPLPKPKPTPTPTQKTKTCSDGTVIAWTSNETEPTCPPSPKKAGVGWVLAAILGLGAVSSVIYFSGKGKKKPRR